MVKAEHFAFNDFPFHYHPEFVLILIWKGSGQLFAGDSIKEFGNGDLYFFGSNLPHTFYNKHLATDRDVHQIVVQFNKGFLGKDFFGRQPFKWIKLFLKVL